MPDMQWRPYPPISMAIQAKNEDIGITGTNGKTTSTYLMEKILRIKAIRQDLMGNIQMKIGDEYIENKATNTQEAWSFSVASEKWRIQGTDYCIMEVSSMA